MANLTPTSETGAWICEPLWALERKLRLDGTLDGHSYVSYDHRSGEITLSLDLDGVTYKLSGTAGPTPDRRSAMQRVIDEAGIPADDLAIVGLSVNRMLNMCRDAGRPSDAARTVCAEYKRDPQRFRERFEAERDADRNAR